MKNKDRVLTPCNCYSTTSLNLDPNQISISGNLSVAQNDANYLRSSTAIGSRSSSSRELWRKRIDNDIHTINEEPNIGCNIDNIAKAMGMSKISFDLEANYADCTRNEIMEMIKKREKNKGKGEKDE